MTQQNARPNAWLWGIPQLSDVILLLATQGERDLKRDAVDG
jgi:hypothetical protein